MERFLQTNTLSGKSHGRMRKYYYSCTAHFSTILVPTPKKQAHKRPFYRLLRGFLKLFPLDRSRWLCGNIIHNAVDILDLIDDTGRDHFQHLIRNPCEVCGHEVRGSYPAESQCVVIGSSVAHYTNGTHIGQHCEVLVNAPVQSGLGDLLTEDPVSVLQNGQLFIGDFADDTNRQPRTRERLPPYQIFRQTQFDTQLTHLVLEQQPQRFDNS